MAVGDPTAVFRPRFAPELYRRRYAPAAAVAPVIPLTILARHYQPPRAVFPWSERFFRARRRFAPLKPVLSFRRRYQKFPTPPLHAAFKNHEARRALFQNSLFADAWITQGGWNILGAGDSQVWITQGGLTPLASLELDAFITQGGFLTIAGLNPPTILTQGGFTVVAMGPACATTWAQCWRITRKDGVVFRYTSLDVDFIWGLETFKSCGSFLPSAAQDNSAIGQVGSQELKGIFDDDGIQEDELYGGLFNDAFAEVWLVDYEGVETPRRIAAGWIGNLQHETDANFTAEVVGPGARLDQQPLVQPYSPGCRWVFGSPECGFDREAHKLSGTVTASENRGLFSAEIAASSASEGDVQWADGLVRWLTGRNAGIECEVKTVEFGSGDATTIQLWALPGFRPQAGDTFELLPGCDLSWTTCKTVYANGINFGGFKDVPGEDSVVATPDAKLS